MRVFPDAWSVKLSSFGLKRVRTSKKESFVKPRVFKDCFYVMNE